MKKSSYRISGSRIRKPKLSGSIAETDFSKYKDLLNDIDQGVCIIRVIYDGAGIPSDYVFVDTNNKFDQLTGLKNLFYKECWSGILEVVNSGKSNQFDCASSYSENGRWYRVFAFPIGKPGTHLVAMFFNDITERKRQEQLLLHNQERFLSVLNNSQDIIYCLNLKTGLFEYFSPSVKEILGYSPRELASLSIESFISLIHPDFVSEVRNAEPC